MINPSYVPETVLQCVNAKMVPEVKTEHWRRREADSGPKRRQFEPEGGGACL